MTTQLATFAGGCFWCMVKPFDRYDGVLSVVSGYTGGDVPNPSYELVCTNTTGHREAVQITFDDSIISYEELLSIFWRQIDPTDAGGQFFDRGDSYKTAIYTHSEEQSALAMTSKQSLQDSGKFKQPIQTDILPAKTFYPAEEGHQDYYLKNPTHYNRYAVGSGRENFKKENWSDQQ
ncbi:peptide-methionine (S)-S-oxide reductase MsrA [Sporosarcina oncorhynchi]|uniref:Peptide methionine sulfoxide reductase MsrA n=1 Tax=Sporosarcina oncorhynchi TaxID=3056444 RepID=A0ABZ0L9M5_9BACL|nr:peptide-methionine (S)-S-oxide reductase MsrA [Sporosarcina sp. T2O-4]WOV88982.1 peptide-methionine (S)-S-oxide reductase MsrA [Sporosarcina sp. T2O-4]